MDKSQFSDSFLTDVRSKSKSSLYFFTKAVLGFNKLSSILHHQICEIVQNLDNPRKIILLPRGHYKSTIATISYSIWLLIQDNVKWANLKGSELRILIANESATNAEHFLSAIEGIFDNNELFRALFPNLIPMDARRSRWNQKEMLINRESSWPEATIETIGVGGAAQSRHYDVIIFDDLIGKEAMDSEVTMEKTITWFDYAESLFVSPAKGIANVIGTRWSKRDLYQHILDNDKRYSLYTRMAIEDGKPIFPEEFTLELFESIRSKNFAHFSSQYLNNPTDPSKCDFKEEWLKSCEWIDQGDNWSIKYSDQDKPIPLSKFDIVAAFDPSIDEKPNASKRALAFVGMDPKQNVVIFDTYSSRDTTDQVIDSIFRLYKKWHPRILAVESVIFSKLYLYILEKEMSKRGEYLSLTPIKVSSARSKDARIRDALQSIAAEGRLYRFPNMLDFDSEFIEFPQGRTKDVLDAVTMCIQLLRQPDSEEDEITTERYDEYILSQRSAVTGY